MSPTCATWQSRRRPEPPDFGAERARLIKAKADIAEMEAEGRRGELLPAEAVEAAWTAVLARLRARILVLPDRLAPLCHEETTIAGVRDQIRKAVREALDELAATPVVVAADPDGTGAAGECGADSAGDPEAAAGALDQ
jgi:phage terminase Nu1 subunit (DNA packaging protein)